MKAKDISKRFLRGLSNDVVKKQMTQEESANIIGKWVKKRLAAKRKDQELE